MYRVLVIGAGSIGERHLRCFLKTGRAAVSVCEQRKDRLQQLMGQYPLAAGFDSIDAVDFSAFDAAVVCVYADQHVPYARRAADARLHVLIEKPLSTGPAGIDELQAVVDKRKLVAGVAHVQRATPAAEVIRKEFDSGKIGQVLDMFWVTGYDHRVARPDYASGYWTSRATGGGAVLDMSSHLSNFIQWFLGPAKSVVAVYDHLQMEHTSCEDTLSYVLRFRNSPAIATVHCIGWQAHRASLVTLNGIKGSIVCDHGTGRVGVVDRANNWTWTENINGPRDSKGQADEPFIRQANNFLDAVEGKGALLCTLAEGKHTMEICEATWQSGQRHAEVVIPS